jgi:hypothetical protein
LSVEGVGDLSVLAQIEALGLLARTDSQAHGFIDDPDDDRRSCRLVDDGSAGEVDCLQPLGNLSPLPSRQWHLA